MHADAQRGERILGGSTTGQDEQKQRGDPEEPHGRAIVGLPHKPHDARQLSGVSNPASEA
jgi:hypothetical protein